jgi:pimeloyl-ACP methyl ester carboxylesterase
VVSPPDLARTIEIPGPWQHRYVAANGARFHVAEATSAADAPLVLLLHGFPEFWWSWRAQLPALADAGFRAVAMDLRGYGGSDKTPRGYDPVTLAQDVSGVVKALGARHAVLVGHGWGGYAGWATAVQHPREVSALCTVSAPHPTSMLGSLRPGRRVGALRHVLAMQIPMLPERRLADPHSGFLEQHLRGWAAPGSAFPDPETVATYQAAISLWPASHCALEYHRWLFRSRMRADGRRFDALMRPPLTQPVCCVAGSLDPALPAAGVERSREHVAGDFTAHLMPGVGHFPPEEDPAAFTEALLAWLGPPTER